MAIELKWNVSKISLKLRNKIEVICTHVRRQTIYDKGFCLEESQESSVMHFEKCIMFAIPTSTFIRKFLPNLTVLAVNNSKLSKITSDDLKGYDCLRDLYIDNCEIEYLPDNLFKHTPYLEIISISDNKIKYIDEDILDPLRNLKIFCLWNNVNIDVKYDILNHNGNVNLPQLKNEIRTKCKPASEWFEEEQEASSEIENLKTTCENQRIEIETMKTQIITSKANEEVQKLEIAELKKKYEDISGKFVTLSPEHEKLKKMSLDQTEVNRNLEKNLDTVLQQFQVLKEISKDFTIKVNQKFFRVHKNVLILHSHVLAKLIAENPGSDILELEDISQAAFQEILNFMNDGSSPSEDANQLELFEASCRLEIDELATIVAEILKKKVNQVNALDVLFLCKRVDKFKHFEELKMKAFKEFQKIFADQTILPELASQPEKLEMLMSSKFKLDEMVAKIHQTD